VPNLQLCKRQLFSSAATAAPTNAVVGPTDNPDLQQASEEEEFRRTPTPNSNRNPVSTLQKLENPHSFHPFKGAFFPFKLMQNRVTFSAASTVGWGVVQELFIMQISIFSRVFPVLLER
jgi:hypothetical protein